MLRLQKLTKTYKTGDQALKAIDLEVPKGQVLALIGPSGAGKSTMISPTGWRYWRVRTNRPSPLLATTETESIGLTT